MTAGTCLAISYCIIYSLGWMFACTSLDRILSSPFRQACWAGLGWPDTVTHTCTHTHTCALSSVCVPNVRSLEFERVSVIFRYLRLSRLPGENSWGQISEKKKSGFLAVQNGFSSKTWRQPLTTAGKIRRSKHMLVKCLDK